MMALQLTVLLVISNVNGYHHENNNHHPLQRRTKNNEIQKHHRYPPYYFSHKYFPSFSAWMMEKDEIYQNELAEDPVDNTKDKQTDDQTKDKSVDGTGDKEPNKQNNDNDVDDTKDTKDTEDTPKEQKYSEKKQFTAFLLALFLGFVGAARFYIGLYVTAVFKLALGLTACSPCFYSRVCCKEYHLESSESNVTPDVRALYILLWMGSCAFFGWWIADVVMFGINHIPDNDGLLLEPW